MKPTIEDLIKVFETRRGVYGRDKAEDRKALADWSHKCNQNARKAEATSNETAGCGSPEISEARQQ